MPLAHPGKALPGILGRCPLVRRNGVPDATAHRAAVRRKNRRRNPRRDVASAAPSQRLRHRARILAATKSVAGFRERVAPGGVRRLHRRDAGQGGSAPGPGRFARQTNRADTGRLTRGRVGDLFSSRSLLMGREFCQ